MTSARRRHKVERRKREPKSAMSHPKFKQDLVVAKTFKANKRTKELSLTRKMSMESKMIMVRKTTKNSKSRTPWIKRSRRSAPRMEGL